MQPTVILLLASLARASTLTARACNEGTQKICYGVDGGASQDLDPDDIQYVADALRYIANNAASGQDKFWTMPKGFDCPEWRLPVDNAGTVLALGKHNNPRYGSSVLFADMADAIDGASSNVGSCGRNGGQIGVVPNRSNPLYSTEEYKKSGNTPDGIVLKLVKAPLS